MSSTFFETVQALPFESVAERETALTPPAPCSLNTTEGFRADEEDGTPLSNVHDREEIVAPPYDTDVSVNETDDSNAGLCGLQEKFAVGCFALVVNDGPETNEEEMSEESHTLTLQEYPVAYERPVGAYAAEELVTFPVSRVIGENEELALTCTWYARCGLPSGSEYTHERNTGGEDVEQYVADVPCEAPRFEAVGA
ncbi:hypothetical protein HY629_03095 [Candidatus Uhrbacteria bacterium]|nr:hypothetical protein [Candidatus Uhrbacteria bacterium]